MANAELVMGVSRSANLRHMVKEKVIMVRAKIRMVDPRITSPSRVTPTESKCRSNIVEAVTLDALGINPVDAKRSRPMDKAVTETAGINLAGVRS